jgi:hypothetical protein
LAAVFEQVSPHLDERQRRLLAGAQARAIGRGGIWNVPDFIDTGLGCQFGEFPES